MSSNQVLRFALRSRGDELAAYYRPDRLHGGADPKYEGTIITGSDKSDLWANIKKDINAVTYRVRRNIWRVEISNAASAASS